MSAPFVVTLNRYEEEGLDGLIDKRLSQVSHRRPPVDEVMRMVDRYRSRHEGWSVRHYYAWYRRAGGGRSYNWVRKSSQDAGAVTKSSGRGQHRKRRERAAGRSVVKLINNHRRADNDKSEREHGGAWELP